MDNGYIDESVQFAADDLYSFWAIMEVIQLHLFEYTLWMSATNEYSTMGKEPQNKCRQISNFIQYLH